jgi:hypothetical protein
MTTPKTKAGKWKPNALDRKRLRAGAVFLRNLQAFEVTAFALSPDGLEQLALLLDKIGAQTAADTRARSKVKVSPTRDVIAFAKANGMGIGKQTVAELNAKRRRYKNLAAASSTFRGPRTK